MEDKKKIFWIIGVIIVIALIGEQGKKEAVIYPEAAPGATVNVIGEVVVQDDITSWVPGVPAKIYWSVCTTKDCIGSIVKSGYKTLTASEIDNLNTRLTDKFKTARYDLSFVAPTQEGYYYYQGQAVTSSNLRVIGINADSNINIGTTSANRFYVRPNAQVECAIYQTTETLTIPNGFIIVIVQHYVSGFQPNCVNIGKNDIGFEVSCNTGYKSNVNGRQSTCSIIPPVVCTPDNSCAANIYSDEICVNNCGTTIPGTKVRPTKTCIIEGNQCKAGATDNIADNSYVSTECTTGYCYDNIGDRWTCEVPSPTRVNIEMMTQTDAAKCNITSPPVCDNSCAANTDIGKTCVNSCGVAIPGTKVIPGGTWSPLKSTIDCGESFSQINSATGAARDAVGTLCESGTCNAKTNECDEGFNLNNLIPFIIIFFAVIIGIKMIGKNQ